MRLCEPLKGSSSFGRKKRKMQNSFSLASPVVPLCNCATLQQCNPAPVQSDLKEREGVGSLLSIPLGLWWRFFIQNSNGSKGVVVVGCFRQNFHFNSSFLFFKSTRLLKSISHHWALALQELNASTQSDWFSLGWFRDPPRRFCLCLCFIVVAFDLISRSPRGDLLNLQLVISNLSQTVPIFRREWAVYGCNA